MPYLQTPDTIICVLSKEGRNLLARRKQGDVAFRQLGFALGRGGYDYDGSSSTSANQTITVSSQPIEGDSITIGAYSVIAKATVSNGTTEFLIGTTVDQTAQNLSDSINANPFLAPYFESSSFTNVVTVISKVTGGIGNFIPLSANSPWATLGGSNFQGGAGESGGNPVKITPIVDNATEAQALLEVTNNSFDVGDGFTINGLSFFIDVNFGAGPTIPITVQNIVDSINDTQDPRVHRLVLASVNTSNPNQFFLTSLLTGDVSNAYPVVLIDLPSTSNFQIIEDMSGGLSSDLEDPAYPVPTGAGTSTLPFILPYGRIEEPDLTSISFVLRCPEGMVGMNAYGEVGIYAEIVDSRFGPEIGRHYILGFSLGSPGTINTKYHGLLVDDPVLFETTGALPSGLTAGVTYYVQNPTEDSFQVSTTPGGLPIAVTGPSSGVQTVVSGKLRQVLFASGHFPIQSKNDRTLLTYRVVINF